MAAKKDPPVKFDFGMNVVSNVSAGEINPGWAPNLAPEMAIVSEEIRKERIKEGAVAHVEPAVKGKLVLISAWGRPAFGLKNPMVFDAANPKGKPASVEVLRMPESAILYDFLGRLPLDGSVTVAVAFSGHRKNDHQGMTKLFDCAADAPASAAILPGAPRQESKDVRDAKKRISKLREDFEVARLGAVEQRLQLQAKNLSEDSDVVDAEYDD
jgi:hypothetical protein